LALRQKHLGPSLSISYQKPLHIVRGQGQYLYDENNQPYLDAVNNVPHVGHSHPQVVKAAQWQTAVLNTNTRYLHDNLVGIRRPAHRHAAGTALGLLLCVQRQRGQRAGAAPGAHPHWPAGFAGAGRRVSRQYGRTHRHQLIQI
jgi:hypothetical protein